MLVFEVLGSGGLGTVRLLPDGATAIVKALTPRSVRVSEGDLRLERSLSLRAAPADAAGWQALLGGNTVSPQLSRIAGGIYGDVDESGNLTLRDVLLVLQAYVGARPPISGDSAEAANVYPANTADGREARLPDVCRPGRECTSDTPFIEVGPGAIDLVDALVLLRAYVGDPQPVVGLPVPPPPPPGPTVRLSRLLKTYPWSSALAINDDGVAAGVANRYYLDLISDPLFSRAVAMRWDVSGATTLLERPADLPGQVPTPDIARGGAAVGINNPGIIVGTMAVSPSTFIASDAVVAFAPSDLVARSSLNQNLQGAPSRVINNANDYIAICIFREPAFRGVACVASATARPSRLLVVPSGKIGNQADGQLGINQRGDVVGYYALRDGGQPRSRGIAWLASGVTIALPPPAGDNCSRGRAINNLGDVVGSSGNCSFDILVAPGTSDTSYVGPYGAEGSTSRAVLWRAADGYMPRVLRSLTGVHLQYEEAYGINDAGVIIGSVGGPGNRVGAVFWTPGGTAFSIDSLGGFQSCLPASFGAFTFAINEHNQVAGDCAGKAAVWDMVIPNLSAMRR